MQAVAHGRALAGLTGVEVTALLTGLAAGSRRSVDAARNRRTPSRDALPHRSLAPARDDPVRYAGGDPSSSGSPWAPHPPCARTGRRAPSRSGPTRMPAAAAADQTRLRERRRGVVSDRGLD